MPQHFGVNQGATHAEEVAGGCLWAPERDSKGSTPVHWQSMTLVQPGDIIFVYANGSLRGHAIASCVYAIRLDPSVLDDRRFREANPQYVEGRDCLYVGMTGRTPDERFERHKRGYKACRYARDFGVELLPAEQVCIKPRTYLEAQRMERRKARQFRNKGCAVWQR